MLSFIEQGTLIIAVEENSSVMRVSREDLIKSGAGEENKIVIARSYAEAAGLVLAHKQGILFESLTSKVSKTAVKYLS